VELAAGGSTVELPVDSDPGTVHAAVPGAGFALQSTQVGKPLAPYLTYAAKHFTMELFY
jgi:hypothetical protein